MGEHRVRAAARQVAAVAFNAMPDRLRGRVTHLNRIRPGNRVVWGNLHRTRPFGTFAGYDRGTPVDRPLIESFLDRHRDLVRGRVLEVKAAEYTRRYGGAAVTEAVIVDIDATNQAATVVADLCEPGSLGDLQVDCVILTQTLQFLAQPTAALANAWAALRPGGAILVTAPCVSGIDPWLGECDRWRFTQHGLAELVDRACPGADCTVEPMGNVLLGAAYLYGLAAEELDGSDYADIDPTLPLTVGAVVRKPLTS
jgi:hypothetical protein